MKNLEWVVGGVVVVSVEVANEDDEVARGLEGFDVACNVVPKLLSRIRKFDALRSKKVPLLGKTGSESTLVD